jgi:hypothetical protein
MDRCLIKLNETLEKINENLILLKDAISSGVGVYTRKDAQFSVSQDHLDDPVRVVVQQEKNERFAVMVHQDPSDGLDVRITNEPLNVEMAQDPTKTFNVKLHNLEEAGTLSTDGTQEVDICGVVSIQNT